MARSTYLWPAIITVAALAVSALYWRDVSSPLRPAVALGFLGICPGMAFVPLLRIRDRLAELALAIALSLSLDAIVAGIAVYSHMWAPGPILAILVLLSLAGAALQLRARA